MTLRTKEQEAADAGQICDAGWRQGAVLDPKNAAIVVPDHIRLDQAEYLMICTQSCSVVSSRFAADPVVELMAVKPLKKFNAKAPEATGKNARKLHIPLSQPGAFFALECDINRRFQHNRSALLECELLKVFEVGEDGAGRLAAWMGRSYTRIALPNKLVDNMRIEFLKQLEQALATPYGPIADPIHFQVPYIYLKWEPLIEGAEVYSLSFLFICSEYAAAGVLEDALTKELNKFSGGVETDGISIESIKCQEAGETFLTDLDGFERFSEWDYLSNLVDVGDARA